MSTSMAKNRSRIIRAVTVAAIAVGLSVGVTAPANAAAEGVEFAPYTLGVVDESPDNEFYWIPVHGIIPMTPTAAQIHINGGSYIEPVLWGVDAPHNPNDLQFTYSRAHLSVDPGGLRWWQTARVPRSVVNEDSDTTWPMGRQEGDELHVMAKFKTAKGNQLSWGQSDRVNGVF